MKWRTIRVWTWLALGLVGLSPAAVLAQSASGIAGVVRDSSGGVLPGVSVEAASSALIEGSRSAVSGSNGQFQVTDLRPGDYTVTFTLPGFRTVRREGIRLGASFTATVNVELSVGQLEETVTVSGAAPLVDVRNTVSQSVMTRETLDAIPSGKDPFAVGQLIAGVTTNTPDVGGTQVMQQPTLQVHGSSNNDNVFMIDNVQIQHIGFGGNQTGFYFNDGLMDEISYQTSSLPAESPVGGVQINMIPRDGGNQFHGGMFATGASEKHAEQQPRRRARARSFFRAQNRVDTVYDLNFTLGGPVVRNRLWFFSTFRRWAANNYLGNTFTSSGAQALDDQRLTDATLRFTGQLTERNKLTVHYDRSIKWRGHRPNNWIAANINEPISSVVQTTGLNYIGQAKWSSPISNRLLAEASVFTMPVNYNLSFQPDAAPDAVATFDQIQSVFRGVSPRQDINSARMWTYAGFMSYVTGAHNLKAGFQVRTGDSQELFQTRGDIVQIVSNGVPNSVRLVNNESGHKEVRRQHRHLPPGLVDLRPRHAQPRPALRALHHVDSRADGRGRPLGAGARVRRPEEHRQLEHHLAALRHVVGRDGRRPHRRQGRAQPLRPPGRHHHHPAAQPEEHRVPDLPVGRRQRRSAGAERRDRLRTLHRFAAAQPRLRSIPTSSGRIQWEWNASVQRQIGGRTSVMLAYFGRKFWDLYTTVNDAVPASAYTPVTITNPLTNQPLTVFNQDPATRGQVRNLLKTIDDLSQRYHGVEVQFTTRVARANVFGGVTIGQNYGDQDSGDLNNPNVRINNRGNIGFDSPYQVRAGFSYAFPAGVQFAGSLRSSSGLPQTRTFVVTTGVVPGLTQVTQNVQVAERGDYRYPWINLLDLRVAKTFTVRGVRVEPMADLFNVFNNNAITNAVQTVGASLGRPSAIVMGRLLRLGGRIAF